jgi:hypothetical protein
LKIASVNVPNLVDLTTGGLGPVIQDPLNSAQTTSLATLNTIGDLLAGVIKVDLPLENMVLRACRQRPRRRSSVMNSRRLMSFDPKSPVGHSHRRVARIA